jgi:hypothetical protein
MATLYDDDLERYRTPSESNYQQEDNKNMAIATRIGGWGTGMTAAPPTGDVPYGVPGMAIPKSFGSMEESITGAVTAPPAAIPRGQSDIERSMGASGGWNIPEKLSSRTSAILERLGSKLRSRTRANLTNELNAILGTMGQLQGQEYNLGVEEARIGEGRRTAALGAIPALTGARKQALEEVVTPFEIATKGMTARAQAARDIAAAEFGGAQTEQTRRETAIMPETIKQAIAIKRAMTKAEATGTQPKEVITPELEEKVRARHWKGELGKMKPDYGKASESAQTEIDEMRRRQRMVEALRTPEGYANYMIREQGSKLKPEQLHQIWNLKYRPADYEEEEQF